MTRYSLYDIDSLRTLLVQLLSRELKVAGAEVSCDQPLTEYGLDSIAALTIAGELEDELGLELPSTLLWDCNTVHQLVAYLHATLALPPGSGRACEALDCNAAAEWGSHA